MTAIEKSANKGAVILVEPKFSKNVGSVARAMSNFGYVDLRLVNPRSFNQEDALVTACWADSVITTLRTFSSMEEAISDCTDVVGFSSAHGKNRSNHCTLVEFARDRKQIEGGQLGLVFGPEDTGLRNEHIPHLRTLIRIPSRAENPSFNLAQAVLLALYEIERTESSESRQDEVPDWQDYLCLDEKLQSILITSGFQTEHTSDDVVRVMRGVFKRLQMNKREMSMLLGFFNKIKNSLSGKVT